MTQEIDGWLRDTNNLLIRLRMERDTTEAKLLHAEAALAEVDRRIKAVELAVEVYREQHNLTRAEITMPDPVVVREYRGKSARLQLLLWAKQHDGEIVMKDIVRTLTAAGLYDSERTAQGALYPPLRRLHGVVRKVEPGLYRQIVIGPSNGSGQAEMLITGATPAIDLAERTAELPVG